MGTGAVVSSSLIPPLERNPFNDPEAGPQAYFVDVRPGVNPLAARRSLEAMTAPLTNSYNFGVVVQSVLRPARSWTTDPWGPRRPSWERLSERQPSLLSPSRSSPRCVVDVGNWQYSKSSASPAPS